MFFFLLQSEHGDLYKVTLSYEVDVVNEIKIKYFDTVPVSNSMCVLKTGFLFVASEFGNQCVVQSDTPDVISMLYQFQGLGDDEESMEISDSDDSWVYFNLHKLHNLTLIDTIESLSPIIDFKVLPLLI
jgi:splicing factor 3B subunit 3